MDDEGFVGDPRTFSERDVTLGDFDRAPGIAFTYLYDFGDHWEHRVELEELLFPDVAPRVASCVAGAKARPPEDVGGLGGYERFLEIMADPDDPEHADLKRWCGGHFDPEWFDVAAADRDVRRALKPDVRRRLHQPRPKRAGRGQ